MNKLAILLVFITVFGCDQTLALDKSTHIEVGIRGNLPERFFNKNLSRYDEQKSGFGFKLMPKWNFSKLYAVGIDVQFNLIADDSDTDETLAFEILSVLPTFQHKLFDTKFSPFYSVGLGGYSVLNSPTPMSAGLSLSLGTTLFRRAHLSFEYNNILTKVKVDEDVINGFDNWSFTGITLTYAIGIK